MKNDLVQEHPEGLDEELLSDDDTQYTEVFPKTIVNSVESPDTGMFHSMNPYQGCEHGCIYCYARNSHEYWGYSAGLDFERKILVKPSAPQLLEKFLLNKNWKSTPIMLSGNTDCYQPIERKLKITREILKIFLKYKHPVGLITKNALILRDLDILAELARHRLVQVMVTVTSLDEELRMKMEPRTVTYSNRLKVVRKLSEVGVPVGVMVAPIVPGINSSEILSVIKSASEHGAHTAGYTIVRLNGALGEIFRNWLHKNFPDRAQKVWNQISECHGGQVNDSRFGIRMRGEGKTAESIRNLFKISVRKYLGHKKDFKYDLTVFTRNVGQYSLFHSYNSK